MDNLDIDYLDKGYNFECYFIENNLENVLEEYNNTIKKKKKKTSDKKHF